MTDPTPEELLEQLAAINGGMTFDPTPITAEQIELVDAQLDAFANCASANMNLPIKTETIEGTERFVNDDSVIVAGTVSNPAPHKVFVYAINGQYVTREEWEAAQAKQIEKDQNGRAT